MAVQLITAEKIAEFGVVAAPDRLTGKPQENKAIFDRLVREYLARVVNELIQYTNTLLVSEDNREAGEIARREAEVLRVTAEHLRVAAEELREKAEILRKGAEAEREKAEQKRASAEGSRESAEQERQKAEQLRVSETEGVVARASVEANRAVEEAKKAESEAGAAAHQADRAKEEADRAAKIALGELPQEGVLVRRANGAIEAAAPGLDIVTQGLIGPAELVSDLKPGGILFVLDTPNAMDYAVTLSDVLMEGDKASRSEANRLSEILTVGVAAALNVRADAAGNYFTEGNIATLHTTILGLCTAAQAGGKYVTESGNTAVCWAQVQQYVLTGKLVSHEEADKQVWSWAKRPLAEVAALRADLEEVRAAMGDINAAIDEVLGGEPSGQ